MKIINSSQKVFYVLFFVFSIIFLTVASTNSYYQEGFSKSGNRFSSTVWNPGVVRITEVLYNPAGTDAGKEGIKIYNAGGQAVNLSGYALDVSGVSSPYLFGDVSINPGKIIIIHKNSGTDSANQKYWPTTGLMPNDSGSIALYKGLPKNSSNIIDFVQYGSGGGKGEAHASGAGIWAAGEYVPIISTEGSSMALKNKNNDTNKVGNWKEQTMPTGF